MRDFRSIVHLDADAFFASVEQAADPRLRGKPMAVGGEKRGIIASASYEARRFGIYTPMPTVRARRLCPKLIIVPGDFEKYERFSRWMFSYAYDFTPDVEVDSIDEGYLDLSGARASPVEIAEILRRAIHQSLKITVSEGIGSNKLVSQIASKLRKPAAFLSIPAGQERLFLEPLLNRWLPGIGPETATRMNAAGLALIGQIAATPLHCLALLVGKTALQMKNFACGIDDRPVLREAAPAKSYGHQETFNQDTTDENFAEATLRRMADSLMATIRQERKAVRTLTVKVRYNDMAEDQCSESLPEPTDLETDLYGRLHCLLKQAWKRRVSLRMVSLKLSQVYDEFSSGELVFDPHSRQQESRRRLAVTVDALREKFGARAIVREHDLAYRTRRSVATANLDHGCVHRPPHSCRPQPARPQRGRLQHVPLNVHSYYSFLDSTLSIEAILQLAQRYELPAIALTDKNNLHGAVEFVMTAKQAGIKPIVGAETEIKGSPVLLYVENATGYANLCRLLNSYGNDLQRGSDYFTNKRPTEAQFSVTPRFSEVNLDGKTSPTVLTVSTTGAKLLKQFASSALPNTPLKWGVNEKACRFRDAGTDGLIAVSSDSTLAPLFPNRFYLADRIAAPPIHYADRSDRMKYDIVQSIRTLTLLRQKHARKKMEGDFHFQSPGEVRERFPEDRLIEQTREIAERCDFNFEIGKLQFPAFTPPDGSPAKTFLRKLVWEGFHRRYPNRAPRVRAQIEQELAIIGDVGYEEYFLVVWSILQECQQRGIEWITRGSAADSLVCYCLGISDVCPIRFDLYFRRFLNKERMALNKLPDIDVDFPHDRKDDVIDLIFEKYGEEHAAVVGGFSTYQARSALADVAKVMGVSEYHIRRFTERVPHVHARDIEEAIAQRVECRDLPLREEPYSSALQMAQFLDGFPRYPKMHPCGVVLSRAPMADLVPCFNSHKGYPTTHFDMDSVEAIGLVKIDVLAQGGLAAIRDVFKSVSIQLPRRLHTQALEHSGTQALKQLAALEPWDDPNVWEMIASGGARAVHHIESPAMVSLCRMCNVRDIDGLIAIVSVIRPGAANECKKMTFTRRYQGLEPVIYPHPSLEPCLKSTFGMIVYEEHILQICEAFAGLTPGRADVLRRALVKQNHKMIEEIGGDFFRCARERGRSEMDIANVWRLVCAFQGYAFCKAHSTAYGVEAYQSAWLKRYYPAEFMAAVLSNGKGFYQPLVYVLECHRLGIPLLPPWINQPGPLFTVVRRDELLTAGADAREEERQRNPAHDIEAVAPAAMNPAIRVPAIRVKGLSERVCERIVTERKRGEFVSPGEFYHRVAPSHEEMELLLKAGAFDGFGKSRTALFWEIQHLCRAFRGECEPNQGWLLSSPAGDCVPDVSLTEPTRLQRLRWESELLDFAASGHPLELYSDIAWDTYCHVADLGKHLGETVVCCGLIIEDRIHEQTSGEPMKFLTLSDWTGMVETELFAKTYKSYGLATVRYPVLEITATVEPYENGRGFSLRVHHAGKPRSAQAQGGTEGG